MTLIDFYQHGRKLTNNSGRLWQVICKDTARLDYVSDDDLAVLEEMREDTGDLELHHELNDVIAWARAFNELVGA